MTKTDCNPFDIIHNEKGNVGKEKNAKIVIDFKGNYHLIKVDKGILQHLKDEKKCDYLILNCERNTASFVELKGRNLADAAEQILNTYKILRSEIEKFKPLEAIIVVRFVDKNEKDNIRFRALERAFKTTNIKIQSRVYTYK